jgi:PmbA protein
MMEEYAYTAFDKSIKKADEVEVFIEKDGEMDLDIQKDRVGFAKEAKTMGLGIRVIVDGKMGFAYTTNMENLDLTVNNAISNAKANLLDENFGFPDKETYPKVKGIYDPVAEELDIDYGLEAAKTLIETVVDMKCQPTSGGYGVGYSQSIIINSNDVFCEDKSTAFSSSISVNAPDVEGVSTAYEAYASCNNDINHSNVALIASQIALDSRGGIPAETKDMDVVLDHHAAAGLLGTFLMAINGDNVQRGRSIYADKLGEQVASPKLDVFDNGTLNGGLGSSAADGEGTASKNTPLIVEGILQNFIYDLYTSKKGSVKSTGNGMRSSFSDMPTVGPSNIVFKFREENKLEDLDNGIMVTNVLGAHTANPISGDFSVEVMNAFQIKDGEIGPSIKKAMLSGNIFKILSNVNGISGEKRQIGPFVIPRLLCSSLRVVA